LIRRPLQFGDDIAERAGLPKSEIRSTKSETNSNLEIPNDPLPQSLSLEREGSPSEVGKGEGG